MTARSQAIAVCDISVTNVRQPYKDNVRECAATMATCSFLLLAHASHSPWRLALCVLAGIAASSALPARVIIDAAGEPTCDNACRRWIAQLVGAAIAAAVVARVGVPTLPTQLGTLDLVREGFAACGLALIASRTRHDTLVARAMWLGGFFTVSLATGVHWFGNPALVIGACLGGVVPAGTLIGALLGVVVTGMVIGVCIPTRTGTPIAELV